MIAPPPANDIFTIRDFFVQFPDDDACLAYIMEARYGMRHTCANCGTPNATFHKISGRRAYACAYCGYHIYPCAGTILQDSRTSLVGWFYAIFLSLTPPGAGVTRKLQRTLGVSFKTAWRISREIRVNQRNMLKHASVGHRNPCDRRSIGADPSIQTKQGLGKRYFRLPPQARSTLVADNMRFKALLFLVIRESKFGLEPTT